MSFQGVIVDHESCAFPYLVLMTFMCVICGWVFFGCLFPFILHWSPHLAIMELFLVLLPSASCECIIPLLGDDKFLSISLIDSMFPF